MLDPMDRALVALLQADGRMEKSPRAVGWICDVHQYVPTGLSVYWW